jgi:carboxylate-amine ligase
MAHRFTIGVEEEFQIIDPATCELRSHVSQIVSAASPDIAEQVKHELHQSIVETGTRICENVSELRIEMHRTRGELVAAAERAGLQVAAAGTHPFSSWIDQVISPGERYQHIIEEMGQLARSLLIFGMHVHVAMPDKQTTIDMMNGVRYFLPHLLALSTSSPFWMGRNTGLKSFRTTVFRRFPRTGVPEQFESWSAYENFVNLLMKLNCIDNGKKIWWDVRPHPTFGTLEFRMFDVSTRVEEAVAINYREAASPQPAQYELAAVRARTDRRKQMARGAVRHQRKTNRLRQGSRSAHASADSRIAGIGGRCGR